MSTTIPSILLLLVVSLESREKLVQLMESNTLTKVSLPVPQLYPASGLAVEVRRAPGCLASRENLGGEVITEVGEMMVERMDIPGAGVMELMALAPHYLT